MGNCGIPTFTCVLLLLIMAALYASASPREDDVFTNYNMAVSDLIQSDDTSVMHLRVAREAQHNSNGARTNLNRRGNPGRTADSGNNGITRAGPRRIGGRPDRRPRPEGRRRRPRPGNRRPLPAGVNRRMLRMATKVHNASNPFAGQLFQEILPTITHNMVISPFSVHTALTMTMLGARRRTARELYNALGLKDVRLRNEKAHQAYQGLRASLEDIHEEVKIHSANAVFVKPNIPLEDSFRQGLSLMYGASFDNFDYNHPLGPAGPVNAWVANMTENRIQNLIGPGTITPLTAMILINAIYFKAAWLRPFSTTSTQQQEFHTLSRGTRMMDMMQHTGALGYSASDGVQVVELPYAGNRLSFYVLLPNEGTDINQLLRQIPHRGSLFEDVNRAHVQLTLPKFRVESGLLDLKRPLQNLGIRKAFDENEADFSGISASAELHIDDVFHKAFIEVNEAGTEAAAATAVVLGLRSSYHPRSVEVNVNRPFLFAIRDKEMKVILFLGAFVGHSAEESG